MGKVVAVVNRKGGVGKTTLTVALADTLISEKAKDVCVLDMDPQASATISLAGAERTFHFTRRNLALANLISARLERPDIPRDDYVVKMVNVIRGRANIGLDVIPNSDAFWSLELDLLQARQMEALQSAITDLINELRIFYDFVLIDCPPGQSAGSEAALLASDLILCPTAADRLSIWGMSSLGQYFERIGGGLSEKALFLINRYKGSLKEHKAAFGFLKDGVVPEGWDVTPEKPMFPLLRLLQNDELRGGAGEIATVRESQNFVGRLGVDSPKTFQSIYGTEAGSDLRKVVNALIRELDR
jgi:chromosome partitioning protein